MTILRRVLHLRRQAGFTLAFTMMLTMVLSMIAMGVMVKIFSGMRNASQSKSRQLLGDAASIGLNMALDELTPGLERMRNTVWSSNMQASYSADATQWMLENSGASESLSSANPVREFALMGNIRNWEPFADWSLPFNSPSSCTSTSSAGWSKGWAYLEPGATVENFDSANCKVMVGNIVTDADYWYRQLQPQPPIVANGAPAAPTSWRNGAKEYPNGAFYSPILKKIYTVRSNPKTRVAVYVRMSFQDYLNWDSSTSTYKNLGFMNKLVTNAPVTNFDLSNFNKNCAITFSIFAVSEPTWLNGKPSTYGTRIHQALNVGVGGMEFIGGGGLDTPENTHVVNSSGTPPFKSWTQPFFPPSLDTPRGDNSLVGGTSITGQVYPASGDLSYNFIASKQATDQVVFLYEKVDLPQKGTVIFLIERIPAGTLVNGVLTTTLGYRRRLLYDWPCAYNSPSWQEFRSPLVSGTPSTPLSGNGFEQIAWAPASYSFLTAPFTSATDDHSDVAWSSMGWFANKNMASLMAGGANQFVVCAAEEHFAAPSPGFTAKTDAEYVALLYNRRYPFTAWISQGGTFSIGSQSAPVNSLNVVRWTNNPLLAWDSASRTLRVPMDVTMPWQGPTVAVPGRATVSYVVTTWPYMLNQSGWWSQAGGRLGLSYGTATQTMY